MRSFGFASILVPFEFGVKWFILIDQINENRDFYYIVGLEVF